MHLDIASLKEVWSVVTRSMPQIVHTLLLHQKTLITAGIILLTALLTLLYMRKRRRAERAVATSAPAKPRFRKREKIMFYGRKIMRKVKSLTKDKDAAGRSRSATFRRRDLLRMARRLLRSGSESTRDAWRSRGPPASLLEADMGSTDTGLPPDVLYMLQSVKVFGHFEQPVFLELCRHIEVRDLPSSAVLFKVGDPDDAIYVVQKGKVKLFIQEQEGTETGVKDVCEGQSIHSLLSVLDCLTGHMKPYKTVSARAVQDSTVLRLPIEAFSNVLERYPESLVRIVQIIMVRLQRVTFMALHNYLGLSSQLHTSQQLSLPRTVQEGVSRGAVAGSARVKDEHARMRSNETEVELVPTDRITDFDAALERARLKEEGDLFQSGSPEAHMGWRKLHSSQPGSGPPEDGQSKALLRDASSRLVQLLGLKDADMLTGRLSIRQVGAGEELIAQGAPDSSLLLVLSGTLQMCQVERPSQNEPAPQPTVLFTAHRGDLVGTLGVLTGEPSFYAVRAKTIAKLAVISKDDIYCLIHQQPKIVLTAAHTVLRRVSPFVRQIDFALDWMHVESARPLYRQEDPANALYIVLNGRLRSVVEHADTGAKELVGEYGRGDLVGIVEIVTMASRATTMLAVRDTEVAVIPSELLALIKRRYPQVVTRLINLLGHKVLGGYQRRGATERPSGVASGIPLPAEGHVLESLSNVSTVALLPGSSDVPLSNVTLELQHALIAIGPTLRLTSDIIVNRLGPTALDPVNDYRLTSWLGAQEDAHRVVLYQCDPRKSAWTRRCIRQADCVLVVMLAEHGPKVEKLEQELQLIELRAQKELVLLHRDDAPCPSGTAAWLRPRDWLSAHHHIRCPKRVLSRKGSHKTQEIYERVFNSEPDRFSDFSRLARMLTGTAIGVSLGGGGARGCSHVGVLRATLEAGIPIDVVGGTSIGALIGGLWAETTDIVSVTQRGRMFAMEFGKIWKKLFDLTYPITSMFSGSSFNRAMRDLFGDRQIEDLWIPYFCISTDITHSKQRIHTTGSLWRYVRSSMSLAGYLPPLCDPVDGALLLDGGYVNNLPADIMRQQGCQTVFAVDVGSPTDMDLTNYGEELSGWWLLWKRWVPWTRRVRVPDMSEVQSRLAYISCVRLLEVVKNSDYCRYMRPPIEKYGTLQFGAFDEINEVGYQYAKALLAGMDKERLQREIFVDKSATANHFQMQTTSKIALAKNVSFTDLATLVNISAIGDKVGPISDAEYESDIAEEGEEDDEEMFRLESGSADEDDDYDSYTESAAQDEDVGETASAPALCTGAVPEEDEDDLASEEDNA